MISAKSFGNQSNLPLLRDRRPAGLVLDRIGEKTPVDLPDIDALILAGSIAASAGGFAGIGLAGAGASGTNYISADVAAYVDGTDPSSDGTGAKGIIADSISITASDTSTIDATVGTASVGIGVGYVEVAISVGVSVARNVVHNDVSTYIKNASANGQSV